MEKTMVKIDMEMPKNCEECRFHQPYVCIAALIVSDNEQGKEERPNWCPLMEVKDDN